MHAAKKSLRKELKRLSISLVQIEKKINLADCLECKTDAGKNFVLIYKKNQELKGKVCRSCYSNLFLIKRFNV